MPQGPNENSIWLIITAQQTNCWSFISNWTHFYLQFYLLLSFFLSPSQNLIYWFFFEYTLDFFLIFQTIVAFTLFNTHPYLIYRLM